MLNHRIYDITFVGQDYSLINTAVEKAVIRHRDKEYFVSSEGKIIEKVSETDVNDAGYCRRILDEFFKSVAPNGICELKVNTSRNDFSKKKLYDLSFGNSVHGGYFCGIIGVIKKQIKIAFHKKIEHEDSHHIGKKVDEPDEYTINVTLQIKSRLDVDENKEIAKPFFLSTLLLRNQLELNDNTVPNSEDEIFDYLLLFWYKQQLINARLKGFFKSYVRFEKNDDRLKGTIDISRHIKMNMGQKNCKIAYSYRENTINNPLNQLIVVAYSHLKKKYPHLVSDNFDDNMDLKRTIDFLSLETGSFNLRNHVLINKNLKPIAHPYFLEYEELRKTCLKILRDETIGLFDGYMEQEAQSILFYLPDLWENFLEDAIKNVLPKDEIKMDAQFNVKYFGYLKEKSSNIKYEHTARPDYVFKSMDDTPFMILDAKCKPRWEDVFVCQKEGGKIEGVDEDYNKCIRDMVVTNSHATGVIFPTNSISETLTDGVLKHPISKYNKNDMFYTIPVKVPSVKENDKYSDWHQNLEQSVSESVTKLSEILIEEKRYAEKIREFESKLLRE